jgi:hypothetical protein
MIYLTCSDPGIDLHVIDIHFIMCEYDYLSGAGVIHMIHGEKIDGNFENVKHILKASVCEFNSSFASDLDWRVVPHQNRSTFACIQRRT